MSRSEGVSGPKLIISATCHESFAMFSRHILCEKAHLDITLITTTLNVNVFFILTTCHYCLGRKHIILWILILPVSRNSNNVESIAKTLVCPDGVNSVHSWNFSITRYTQNEMVRDIKTWLKTSNYNVNRKS